MKRKKRKKLIRINNPIKQLKTGGLLLVLFFIFLMSLFAETVKTLPVGASSEYYKGLFDIPKLSLDNLSS